MLEKETQKHIRLENLLRMLSESSFIESSIFVLESGFSIVESGFLKRESEHESGFFPSPDFLRVRVQVRSGFRSMPSFSALLQRLVRILRILCNAKKLPHTVTSKQIKLQPKFVKLTSTKVTCLIILKLGYC